MSIKYQPGRVYLRDRRNGVEYEYEQHLAGNPNMEPFTPVEATKKDEQAAIRTAEQQAEIDAANAKLIADAEAANAQQGVEASREAVIAAAEQVNADEVRTDVGKPATAVPSVPAPPAKPATPAKPAKPAQRRAPTPPARRR